MELKFKKGIDSNLAMTALNLMVAGAITKDELRALILDEKQQPSE